MRGISYNFVEVKFDLNNTKPLSAKLDQLISSYGFICGELTFIFVSDIYLLKINKEYLNHDYFTDVITFSYNQGKIIKGDIFISYDRVMENADKFKTPFYDELYRVMIHGVLHLVGLQDKTKLQKNKMRKEEDKWLERLR